MIEYAKSILPKISQWKLLFKKELIKCIQWAEPEEWFELRNWCYDNFYDLHPDVLTEVFNNHSLLQAPVEIPNNSGIHIEFKNRKLSV